MAQSKITGNGQTGGLIGYWKFDEGTGTTTKDSTGYGNTGTLVNTPTWSSTVPPAITFTDPYCLTFSTASSQYVNAGAAMYDLVQKCQTFTYAAWVYPTSLASPQKGIMIAGRDDSAVNLTAYLAINTSKHLLLSISAGGSTVNITGTTTFAINTWYHVVGVYDGSFTRLYVNGASDATAVAASGSLGTANRQFYIGCGSNNPNGQRNYFDGSIDDVRVYNRALTSGEVTTLYGGSVQPLAGAWNMLKGNTGATALDSSGGGHTGTLVNKPSTGAPCPSLTYTTGPSMQFIRSRLNNISMGNVLDQTTGDFSVSVWYKCQDTTVSNQTIFSKLFNEGVGSNAGWSLGILTNAGLGQIRFFAQTSSVNFKSAQSNAINIDLSVWHHYAATRTGTTLKVSTDGVLDTGSTTGGTLGSSLSSTNALLIGADAQPNNYAVGLIKDVRIYNKVLSAGEITTLASGVQGLTDATLIGWWKLDQGLQSIIMGS